MNLKQQSWSSARTICIVKTLAKLGHYPTRESEKEAWFLSPLRSETQASFNVSLIKNLWYDFGTGKGGNVIDLVMLLENCSFQDAEDFLSDPGISFSFSPEIPVAKKNKTAVIDMVQVQGISHPALSEYLRSRGIPLAVGNAYCKEIRYGFQGREFFSLGVQNHLGGWELRNKYFKGSCSPKSYTHLKNGSCKLLVTEGMFDLLSLAVLEKELMDTSDVIILNSVAFLAKIQTHIPEYDQVFLYLDNDSAGDSATRELLTRFENITDKRTSYKNFKDLNEKLNHEK
ncbi:toprim domain-containing protein [Gillisia sp. Q332]|uniref:toprim domain-containing protein n=1 Tax=Gillisia xinjiangensis TaxID=3384765 RepID=UPI00391CB992